MNYVITRSPYNGLTNNVNFTIDETKNTSVNYSVKKEVLKSGQSIGEVVDFDYELAEGDSLVRTFLERKFIDNNGVPFEIKQDMNMDDIISEIEMLRDLSRALKSS
ncbi:hypothetical protein [Cytobacillus praedii]|uniref:Uncharacterized protein n=1 Tax=Cytobacillus praedii TaxID=1742358 RepID=A0A4R1AUA2_9BACI|nr:hypothetical protein [Cytobacillus praedii]TCJ01606.1 hypothetical protein E0Y62_23230 [Cytobacillus praedii]